jgi:hypothetical protein
MEIIKFMENSVIMEIIGGCDPAFATYLLFIFFYFLIYVCMFIFFYFLIYVCMFIFFYFLIYVCMFIFFYFLIYVYMFIFFIFLYMYMYEFFS